MPHPEDKVENEIKEHEFQDEIWECGNSCGTCCMGFWCPCILVNRTRELIKNPREKKPDSCGLIGCGWCLLSMCGGWGAFLTCYQRGEIRREHGINGSECGDCMWNFCCPCCSIIQQYSDVEKRRDALNEIGYQSEPDMVPQR